MSLYLYPNWGQVHRAGLIAQADFMKSHDVLVFSEAWDKSPRDTLVNGLKSEYPYWTEAVGHTKSNWDSTTGSYNYLTPLNGGVVIMSKWPILEKHQYIYTVGCGADWFALKGFAYVKINYKGKNLHIFGTHLQSDDKGCRWGQAASMRMIQLQEMRSYIDGKNIPKNELVLMSGDFNIVRDTAEFDNSVLGNALQAHRPTAYTGHSSTWDPTANAIANYYYPSDAPQYIDFTLVDKNHAQAQSNVQDALKIKSPSYVLKGETWDEYSGKQKLSMGR
ncbi:Sphingomyelin phosphodiesterase 3 [Actinomortierella ambigua]|uniref:sphingomyelin phosphodiesterase n=1 Tax=Actinomortierella ambigua TaxID=1343610 RepID=A0A9P6PY74_9FUNG|nr:Sphingomyelin phosphodiesterase 3 [Actinomortierella ambigua]